MWSKSQPLGAEFRQIAKLIEHRSRSVFVLVVLNSQRNILIVSCLYEKQSETREVEVEVEVEVVCCCLEMLGYYWRVVSVGRICSELTMKVKDIHTRNQRCVQLPYQCLCLCYVRSGCDQGVAYACATSII